MRAVPVALTVRPVPDLPEIVPGDDLTRMLIVATAGILRDGDILVVTSKVISKAEGRIVLANDRDSAITAETTRVVATREERGGNVTRIVENRLGIVAAAAGVDASNTPSGTVLLLPLDPDASARRIAEGLRATLAVEIGVIVSDTLGRPWREGQTDCAIGAAGVVVMEDLRGANDAEGRPLTVTAPCVADELASAADLVKRKLSRVPVAIVSGRQDLVGSLELPGARSIVRPLERDMFALGTREAWESGYGAGLKAAEPRTGRADRRAPGWR